MKWTAPKIWEGKEVSILASGPSMNPGLADQAMACGPTIAVNTTYELALKADVLYAADMAWWERHRKGIARFAGLKVSITPCTFAGVHVLQMTGQDGFDPDPANLRTGGNSGYQAIHLAAHMGARKINLYGFDMRGGRVHHWHGVHPTPLRNHGESIYKRWLASYETLAPELKKRGIEVVNCTPGSALQCFPFQSEQKQMAA